MTNDCEYDKSTLHDRIIISLKEELERERKRNARSALRITATLDTSKPTSQTKVVGRNGIEK